MMARLQTTIYAHRTPQQKKFHMIFRLVLSLIVIFCALAFAHELVYPTYRFYFRSSIDSLANTISRPYVTAHGTGIDIGTSGDFSKAHITITLPADDPRLPENASVLMRRSYRAFFAPLATDRYSAHITKRYEHDDTHFIVKDDVLYPIISENAARSYLFGTVTDISSQDIMQLPYAKSEEFYGFAPATLIASRDGIFVTEDNTKHPIQDENTFSALGYDYDNVIETTSRERNVHKKARMITVESTHPFGTLFYARDAQRMYIYDDHALHKIDPTVAAKRHAIAVDERSRTTFDSCKLTRSLFDKQTYSCVIKIENTAQFTGNTYQFTIADMPGIDIERAIITLSTQQTSDSLSHRIEELKQSLRNLYTQ
jgi:hypothetical protein